MPYGVDKIAIDLLKFADYAGIGKDFIIVSHSFGSLVGLRMALIA